MIFPKFNKEQFRQINLDSEAERWFKRQDSEENSSLLDPVICQKFIEECHQQLGIDFSYGGWMESRSTLWRGSYLDDEEKYIHLGIDFNVPAGTEVAITKLCTVIRIDNDYPEKHGWGNRIIVHDHQKDIIIIFAHLETPVGIQIGDILTPGKIIARVGNPSQNGGWFPHLHIQMITPDHYHALLKDELKNLDGYGRIEDIDFLKRNFPNPMEYLD